VETRTRRGYFSGRIDATIGTPRLRVVDRSTSGTRALAFSDGWLAVADLDLDGREVLAEDDDARPALELLGRVDAAATAWIVRGQDSAEAALTWLRRLLDRATWSKTTQATPAADALVVAAPDPEPMALEPAPEARAPRGYFRLASEPTRLGTSTS